MTIGAPVLHCPDNLAAMDGGGGGAGLNGTRNVAQNVFRTGGGFTDYQESRARGNAAGVIEDDHSIDW
jgi:hypothetical protein